MSERVVDTGTHLVSWEQVGTGPDLVLLHSLLTDHHAFDPLVPVLADRYRLNLVDLPGFGRSAPAEGTIDAYADVVGAFLEAGGFDRDRTGLVGNGLGAFVALGTAIRHGDRFRSLGLVGCGVAFPEPARETFARMAGAVEEGGMEAVVEVAVRRIFPDEYLASHPHVGDERRQVLLRTDPDSFVAACRALQRLDYRSEAGAVSNPTWIVVGSEDAATPPEMAEEAHHRIAGSRLVIMDGLGHAPHLQDPVGFSSVLDECLAIG